MRCVLEALAALHDANVVFGDVKPSNFVRTKVSQGWPCRGGFCISSLAGWS
jgi:serine/threonine protein kinase